MLSGIGPSAQLVKHKIPLIHSLPVGKNFLDNAAFGGLIFVTNETLSENPYNIDNILKYAIPNFKDH